jgi:hypothetical protein
MSGAASRARKSSTPITFNTWTIAMVGTITLLRSQAVDNPVRHPRHALVLKRSIVFIAGL